MLAAVRTAGAHRGPTWTDHHEHAGGGSSEGRGSRDRAASNALASRGAARDQSTPDRTAGRPVSGWWPLRVAFAAPWPREQPSTARGFGTSCLEPDS